MHQFVQFSKQDKKLFFKTLQQRVNTYFKSNEISKTANLKMYVKTTSILLAYFVPLIVIYFGQLTLGINLLLYFIMGLAVACIGLCIMHDANHGAYSKNKTINKILGYSLNLIGGSSFTWKIQHNFLHHTYPNVYQLDEDIDDKPFLRLSPHGKLEKYHRFQHLYAFLLYSLATISWVLMKDFRQLKQYNSDGLTEKNGFDASRESRTMITSKVIYFFYILVLPILLGVAWWHVLLGFLLLHLVAGLLITVVFQLAHVVEGPAHLTAVNEEEIANTWAIHQLFTTANFSTKNRFITWFVGGLNFQIEHHLFPHICHIHYPKIAKIVRETVKEFNLPYYEFEYFHGALLSHIKMLKRFGTA